MGARMGSKYLANNWLAARFPRRRMPGRHAWHAVACCGMRHALARRSGEASSRGLLACARCVAPSLYVSVRLPPDGDYVYVSRVQ